MSKKVEVKYGLYTVTINGTSYSKGIINKIKNALVESFGSENYRAAYAQVIQSPRFGTLAALAGHGGDEAFQRLIIAALKLAKTPKTKAML